jgi:hypothetical protein
MKKTIMAFALLMTGCASLYQPESWDDQSDKKVHTLRLFTGSMGESLYVSNFEKKAKEVCPKGYTVLEKTREPKTLHPNLHKGMYYNWVIQCN